jgi:hypothetical protein
MREQITERQKADRCQQNEAYHRKSRAHAPPARCRQRKSSQSEHKKEIGRQNQKGDGLREDEEHQRVFFQSS